VQGKTLSHYRVLERLGGGGMGAVYKALDTRLDRHVAIKLLPLSLTDDDEARARFTREARAASALDHPNICTIYDIDSTDDGQLFIAMAFYDGETIKGRLTRGPMPVPEALDVAIQVGQGLAKAHEAGIVHRDIKPANVMLTRDGLAKIVDFGVAKLAGSTDLTRTGASPGTVAYMSPEQLQGGEATPESDVWALGATLFEMLTGRPPFEAESEWAIASAITTTEARSPRELRPELGEDVEQLVLNALSRQEARYSAIETFLTDARACYGSAPPVRVEPTPRRASARMIAGGATIAAVLAATFWLLRPDEEARWAETQAITQIERLIEQDEYGRAFELAERAEGHLGNDARLAALWSQMSRTMSLTTTPSDAEVVYKPYADVEGPWRPLGRTPLEDARLPIGYLRIELRADGLEPLERTIWRGDPEGASSEHFDLAPPITGENMVRVVPWDEPLRLIGLPTPPSTQFGEYAIDRVEVTNAEFMSFVQAGGYEDEDLWRSILSREAIAADPREFVAQFVDATGRPGPSTWAVGTFPDGEEDYPVGGVSWFEAAAFCAHRDKELPTAYHWLLAGSLAPAGVPMSNLAGTAPEPVGQRPAQSTSGAYDMAGNLREWVYNRNGDRRLIMGGSYQDPQHQYAEPDQRPALDRAAPNGFRCIKHLAPEPIPELVYASIEREPSDFRSEPPVSDEVFEAYLRQFAYDPLPLDAEVVAVDDSRSGWMRQKITYNAPYDGETAIAFLWVPKNSPPPHQVVVLFPGSSDIVLSSSDELARYATIIEFLPTSGRAVLYPIYKGTYERNDGSLLWSQPNRSTNYRDHLVKWVQDFSRAVDYLETREDMDTSKLAYFGYSWGGTMGAIVPAVETRVKASVLVVGGFWLDRALPEVDQATYVTRVRVPTLMLTGREDYLFPYEASQLPMFDLLGTPDEHKRLIAYDGTSHDVFPAKRHQMVKETLDWLDTYLGPVGGS
jgi:dienelactone hydrolase